MKTAITRKIDNVEIIVGFDSEVLDPETTKEKAKEQLKNDEVFLALLQSYYDKMQQKTDEYRNYYNKCRADESLRTKAAYDLFLHGQNEIQLELIELASQIKTSKKAAFNDNLTYFEPKLGEIPIDDSSYSELISKINSNKKNEYCNLEGETIEDNRGKSYHKKDGQEWSGKKIELLGDKKPDGSFYADELDDNQRLEVADNKERNRIRSLSEEKKQAEIDSLMAMALHAAAIKMNEIELSDGVNAKEKAKEWLDAEKEKIQEKYNV